MSRASAPESVAKLQEKVEKLTSANKALTDANEALRTALAERAQISILFTHQPRVSRNGDSKTVVQAICVTDSSKEGIAMYNDIVERLEAADDTLPDELSWETQIQLPINEVHHLPDGLIL